MTHVIVSYILSFHLIFLLSSGGDTDTIKVMESKQPVSDGQKAPDTQHTGVILATIGDTTWRMFVPTIGFTLLGVWLDGSFDTKPWLMFGGIIIGFLGAFLLVKKQIDGLKTREGRN